VILTPVTGWRANTFPDAFTTLLLHCDGADASTSFPDASATGSTITANGNAQVDTAQSKFGGASALFDGTGDFLSAPSISGFQLGSGNFTLDFWIRFAVGTSWSAIGKGTEWSLYGDTNRWVWKVNNASNVFVINWTPSLSTWYHGACVRNGTTTTMYINGTSIGSGTSVNVTDSTGALNIGDTNAGVELNGWMDEVRISKGIARWTAGFTPPAAPYS
jgi:hypothetical protein